MLTLALSPNPDPNPNSNLTPTPNPNPNPMEVCPPARKPFAVTLVLSGGVLAAFAGPQLSVSDNSWW